MRNRFPGVCYRCGTHVPAGGGHFERQGKVWLVQHAACAIAYRGSKEGREAAVDQANARRWFDVD